MVGQGVLRECILAQDVEEVVAITRSALPCDDSKLREWRRPDLFNWAGVDLSGFDACFFCLGMSAVGQKEAEYRHVTFDLTLGLAQALLRASPQAVFVYVSGQGTNANGRAMWARVKGATENALLALRFRGVYCFRPGYIQPLHGIRSKTDWYNLIYRGLAWLYPLLQRVTPGMVTSTQSVGRAMLAVATRPWPEHVLGPAAINAAARARD